MALDAFKKFSAWKKIFGNKSKLFSTMGQFMDIQAVNIITNIGILVYLMLFFTLIICEIINIKSNDPIVLALLAFIPSITELTSVFIGFVLAFYWQEAHKIKTEIIEKLEIYRAIKNEFEYNNNTIDKILSKNISYNFPLLLKTTSWDAYKDKIGNFKNDPNSELLTKIYHDILQFNEGEKLKSIVNYDYDREIVNSLKKNIVKDGFTWINNQTEKYNKWDIKF